MESADPSKKIPAWRQMRTPEREHPEHGLVGAT
nr:MAG TPA: hypothetical protein [Caudoviricetes sp.]DAL01692.1 MAG TPA: hypothetical protein [Caudoviricetes sp.]DAS30279.1 MAG TPA: hypothetical protein [Caudoviricetes sp.]DAS65229.1 MAG TPA: hypothetical protein [Caudoviricetes sp.]